ncbi:MAG TPA: threonine/serine dehydratase [Gaiellaceae bacterium]
MALGVKRDSPALDVVAASAAIGSRLHRTPLLGSRMLGEAFGGTAVLKCELFQRTGSFKARGVLTKLASLSAEEKQRGVISISAGNHACALAYGCALERVDCVVVMWQGASEQKIRAARAYGATVDLEAADPTEAFARLESLQEESGRTLVHPFDDPLVMAGQGTVALEILEDRADVEVFVVPTGGGGLVSGIAAAVAGRARVVAVEPEGSDAMHAALAAGKPVPVQPQSIADGLSAPFAGGNALAVCLENGVESVLVTEAEIEEGVRFLYGRAKLAAEPAAGVGVGALLAGKVPDVQGKTVAAVVSGGNVAGETAAAILGAQ